MASEGSDGEGGELMSQSDLSVLRKRISRIQERGLTTPSQTLFEIATEKPPAVLLRDFFMEAPAPVQQAMQDAVVSLLGNLPPFQFDSTVTTTGDRLAALMLQLQMTGYMLRNAQYVMKLRQLLNIRSRNVAEYHAAFKRVDTDKSGFLTPENVEALLREVYGESPPAYEVKSLMKLFDTNLDGVISWTEFCVALGMPTSDVNSVEPMPALGPVEESSSVSVSVSGNVTLSLEGGRAIEVDAAAYMEELQAEAAQLRAEIASLQKEEVAEGSLSLSRFVSSLPEDQMKVLTSGISEDVVGAMRMVVNYILQAPGEDKAVDLTKQSQISLEQEKLQQLCLYQLVLGYRLREAEATGEAEQRLGL
eukprot:CAMPEP_0119319044 /NCGR_PEP_ID=MMETSP1333-20130426/48330_1 /TAXON_ID=418940 /ORGANISM="Scyphosphaera apsteinii, Strain RCC1455" /LENGTH=362 /DNA_ID=CAMNT_0007325367 /DNA_START=111 /DNA_END=1199 /DNA_ORIENTATION=-